MKQLIPQSKIEKAAKEYALLKNNEHEITFMLSKSDFKSGVKFALNEIQPLMIELLDFAFINFEDMITLKEPRYMNINTHHLITIQQLLDEFIQQKTMKELESLLEFESEEERQEFMNDKTHQNKL